MRVGFALIVLLVLAACGGAKEPQGPAIVVLATGEEGDALTELLADFTDDTGVPVSIEWGSSTDNADRLIEKVGIPADVLITDNIADAWRVADSGAFRPVQSPAVTELHPSLKDPDGYWAAIDVRTLVIVHRNDARPLTASYDDLGAAQFMGRVCLSSPQRSSNRALIAFLIDEKGVKESERLVRRWVKNLAMPPFTSEEGMLDAIRTGDCDYGIATMAENLDGLTPVSPPPHYVDAGAVGVGRHAQQAESAHLLVDWLLRNHKFELRTDEGPPFVGIVGWRDEEVRLLAERAAYR